jgi:glycerol-3-phosphate responsive antiterminator
MNYSNEFFLKTLFLLLTHFKQSYSYISKKASAYIKNKYKLAYNISKLFILDTIRINFKQKNISYNIKHKFYKISDFMNWLLN